jgi:serine/threonine-protein kinase
VAIKILREQYAKNPALLKTLQREILTSRQLRHPNIAPVHDFYDGPRGIGVVMDLLKGVELADWERQHKGQLVETAQVRLDLLIKIFEGLQIAHKKIIHRDLKPDNIMLRDGDPSQPVIMDFGFALQLTDQGPGCVVGTPKYMAPEQALTPADVDSRCDLFAMGVIAYELFTDRIPPTSLASLIVHTSEGPKFPPVIPKIPPEDICYPSAYCAVLPPALDRLIIQLMAFVRDDRPQSAAQVLDDLLQIRLQEANYFGRGCDLAPDIEALIVPKGQNERGSSWKESKIKHERPRRRVQLTEFRMGRFPVTNAAYRRFLEDTGYSPPPLVGDPQFGRDNHPVVAVTWDDARAYAEWAGGALPTEAQWEYAARGGKQRLLYPWGDEKPTEFLANIDWILPTTSAVGSYPQGRNAFGIEDMCGNIWEWCQDVWSEESYSTIEDNARDPLYLGSDTDDLEERVLRGGAFNELAPQGRCAARFHRPRSTRSNNIGFRLVWPGN